MSLSMQCWPQMFLDGICSCPRGSFKFHSGHVDRVGQKPSARFSVFLAISSFSCKKYLGSKKGILGHWKIVCMKHTASQWLKPFPGGSSPLNEKTCSFVL